MRTNRVGLLLSPPVRHALTLVAALMVLGSMSNTAVAQTPITDSHVPFGGPALNPCTSEIFTFTAFFHLKSYFDTTPNGHLAVEMNVEDAKGTTTSGVRYVATHQDNIHTIFDIPDGAPTNQTVEIVTHFIREKQDPSFPNDDFYLRFKAHLTINSNGVVTVQFSDYNITCK